jgi:streptomycin 6-kinase
VRVPESLAWWAERPGGREWLDRLPVLAAACAERWRLELGAPLKGGNVALVLAATREDGAPAVLKISFPEEESEHEPDALAHWDGRGAVRMLERDADRRAMLLERVSPGSPLWDVADDEAATVTAGQLLRRLHGFPVGAGHPFASLANAAARWSETIPADWRATGRAFSPRLVDLAVDSCRTLVEEPVGEVLLHQDFHGGNVLCSGAEEWLAIDAKPLVGDPAFDAASLVRDRRWLLGRADDAHLVRRRLDVLAEVTGLDRERMRLWGIVHALAWGVSGGRADAEMIRSAELLLRA